MSQIMNSAILVSVILFEEQFLCIHCLIVVFSDLLWTLIIMTVGFVCFVDPLLYFVSIK